MKQVRAKKNLGQHFLTDESIAERIAHSLTGRTECLLEIGPGMGVLTKYLIEDKRFRFKVVELDRESVEYLHDCYPELDVIEGDFLRLDLSTIFDGTKEKGQMLSIIGNFPYNISSQILFRVFENRDLVPEVVGMFQKEVAERVAAGPGSKTYGILSVLLSAFYNIEYLFTVHENVFNPPPKVKSAVIRLTRNDVQRLDCDERLFVTVVKTAFNQRRKTMRNALKPLNIPLDNISDDVLAKRAEQLSVEDFVSITSNIQETLSNS
ncbi:MAG: 16S rRNA (adenine(1518)-N(6)/adenine(1519)-N(6))-dimethyltransferase RsmA [Bacteroidales bacterium]|nr:16S rRNA (adenine(1518)-N(6)/adenine(1519)-N(6))-dimethyltransferase RsmA [Bacteroidales bacterium]